ncbi:MAG: 23S rRNA (adenine(1618)-N(6))-methyltransferase RlmF [Ewingella sp.]
MENKKIFPQEKSGLHPRNRHRSRYDFPALIISSPELEPFVSENKWGDLSVDFADPQAVKALNRALLRHFYQIENWEIPADYLCPPIPGRADYVHHLADLLAGSNQGEIPKGKDIAILDIGVGANCIYPIIGLREYGWRFTASEIDATSMAAAKKIVATNPLLTNQVRFRLQAKPPRIFDTIIRHDERYDAVLCNPPFHGSAEEAAGSSQRKRQNLGIDRRTGKSELNFGGQHNELWCEGGEESFVVRMAEESAEKRNNCLWFTVLISKKTTLPLLYEALEELEATDVRTAEMTQGNKISRFVAWTFLTPWQQKSWADKRWN